MDAEALACRRRGADWAVILDEQKARTAVVLHFRHIAFFGSHASEVLRAFGDEATLRRADEELSAHGYRTHEFGDSVFIERSMPALDSQSSRSLEIQPELSHY